MGRVKIATKSILDVPFSLLQESGYLHPFAAAPLCVQMIKTSTMYSDGLTKWAPDAPILTDKGMKKFFGEDTRSKMMRIATSILTSLSDVDLRAFISAHPNAIENTPLISIEMEKIEDRQKIREEKKKEEDAVKERIRKSKNVVPNAIRAIANNEDAKIKNALLYIVLHQYTIQFFKIATKKLNLEERQHVLHILEENHAPIEAMMRENEFNRWVYGDAHHE